MPTEAQRIETAVSDATDAFWEVIAAHFEEIKSGDLDPLTTNYVNEALTTAVKKWLEMNKGE